MVATCGTSLCCCPPPADAGADCDASCGAAATSAPIRTNAALCIRREISPQTFERAAHELVRVAHLRVELLRRIRRDRLARALPPIQQRRQALVDPAVHVVLRLEIRERERRPAPGHE